jgi:general secretion pathway protein F
MPRHSAAYSLACDPRSWKVPLWQRPCAGPREPSRRFSVRWFRRVKVLGGLASFSISSPTTLSAAILGIMATAMVTALMVWVVPKLVEQFAMLGASELPPLTRFVIGLSGFVRDWGLVVLLLASVSVFLVLRVLKIPAWKRRWDALILRVPFFGDMNRKVASARFARIHATMSGAGATVLESLSGARNAMGNMVFRDAADQILETVQRGGALSSAMKATGVFPQMMVHMVASGEAARNVPAMMNRAADFLEDEFETATNVALGLLEPLIIIFLGGIVGTIVLSIMLPIMQLNTLALG